MNREPSSAKDKETINPSAQLVALELAKAFRAFELYPVGHPQLRSIINFSYEKILPELKKMGEIIFTVGREGLYFEGKLLEGFTALKQFTAELHIRQIRKFAFRPNLELRELIDFLELLLTPVEEFRTGKKIENYFQEKRIQAIWVNEVDFGKVFSGKAISEEKEEKEGEEIEEAEEATEIADDFRQIDFLIRSLDTASEDSLAQEVLEKIEQELKKKLMTEQFSGQWYLLGAVSDFLEQKAQAFPRAGGKAQELIKNYCPPKFLAWLVNNFIQTGEATGRAYSRYFEQVGEPVLKVMLERLMTPETIYFQKELINYLKRKGKIIRPMVEALLAHQKSSPNFKLVYLLGEIRSSESVPLLLELAKQAEPGFKREIIRALAKIKSKQASLGLISMLRDKTLDSEGLVLLVQTLGELQELVAVSALSALLKDRYQSLEVREKAAEALGKIGSYEAVPALLKVLKKPWFFLAREPDRLRLKSVEALARIGGERAEAMLLELSQERGIVGQYCQELLQQIRSRKGGGQINV